MKLVSFVYCQDAIIDNAGNPTIVAPLQMLAPVNLPTNFSFAISFGLLGKVEEYEGKEVITTIKNPDKVDISKNLFVMPSIPDELKGSVNPIGIQINVEFKNVVLDKEGVYTAVVEMGGDILKECPIDVYGPNK